MNALLVRSNKTMGKFKEKTLSKNIQLIKAVLNMKSGDASCWQKLPHSGARDSFVQNQLAFIQKNFYKTLVFVYLLIMPTQIWATICLSAATGLTVNYKLQEVISEVEHKTRMVYSVGSLADFLLNIAELEPSSRGLVTRMAETLFTNFELNKIHGVVRNLILSPRHVSQHAVISALNSFHRGEDPNASSIVRNLPKPVNEKTFALRTSLGEQMTEHTSFKNKLKQAIDDLKGFNHAYGQSINAERAFRDVINGISSLQDPLLIGELMELFLKADQLTAQYILDKMIQVTRLNNGEYTLVLHSSNDKDRISLAKKIASLLSTPFDVHQEIAFFDYTNDLLQHPSLIQIDAQLTKKVAIRYIERLEYDLTNKNLLYPSAVLAQLPIVDQDIDDTLIMLLSSGLRMPDGLHRYFGAWYAIFELQILERNAKNLSSISVDLRFSRKILLSDESYIQYNEPLLALHFRYNLSSFPYLNELAINFFKRHPESLDEFQSSNPERVEKFRRDLGI